MVTWLLAATIELDIAGQAPTAGLSGSQTDFGGWLGSVLSGAMTVAALLVLLYLVWGAMEWIFAGGDSSKVQKARDRMTQAVVGLIVLASTIAIFNFLQIFLGLDVLEFAGGKSGSSKSSSTTQPSLFQSMMKSVFIRSPDNVQSQNESPSDAQSRQELPPAWR